MCGIGTVEVFTAADGEYGTRIVDHIPCVIAADQGTMRARELVWSTAQQRDHYRDLFRRANAEKRMWRQREGRWQDHAFFFLDGYMIRGRELEYRIFQWTRYRDLFRRANSAKRYYREAYLDVLEADPAIRTCWNCGLAFETGSYKHEAFLMPDDGKVVTLCPSCARDAFTHQMNEIE